MNTLRVQGMHCDACKKLIMMELDDAGLSSAVVHITLKPENMGGLELRDDLSLEDVEHVRTVIRGMENYDVVA